MIVLRISLDGCITYGSWLYAIKDPLSLRQWGYSLVIGAKFNKGEYVSLENVFNKGNLSELVRIEFMRQTISEVR